MYATFALLALIGYVAASPALLLGRAYDDGQWHPEFDGSALGSGALRWGLDDGSWKPALDGSALGRGDLAWLNRRKRDLLAVDPNSLSHPLDEPITAAAKNAQLIQQQTEATRNILGGGIPLDLPADTPEVAAGKQAHAIAHENQKLSTGIYSSPVVASRIATAHVAAAPVATAHIAAPYAATRVVATPYAATNVVATPYATTNVVATPYAATNVVATPYAATRVAAAPIATAHIATDPYATTHVVATPYSRIASPAYAYGIAAPTYAHAYGFGLPAIY